MFPERVQVWLLFRKFSVANESDAWQPVTLDKSWGAIHAPALPEGSGRGLVTPELPLCLAVSPTWSRLPHRLFFSFL